MDEQGPDPGVAQWLAAATGDDPRRVERELDIGRQRRTFVVNELIEAGLAGPELLQSVLRLTGLTESSARELIAALEPEVPFAEAEAPTRDSRLAENEIIFRLVNERIAEVGGEEVPPEWIEIVCECSDRDCLNKLTIRFSEYHWLRQNPRRFAVLPGHEAPAIEDVVERFGGYVVVEKHAETHAQVEAADPRS